MFSVKVNSKNWTGFETMRVESNFLLGSSTAHITLPPKNYGELYPIRANAAIQIFLHGQSVMNGYVDAIQPSVSMSGMSIMLTVRDKMSDLIDSTINPKKYQKLPASIKLPKLISDYVNELGVDMQVIASDAVKQLKPFTKKKQITPNIGDSYFTYLSKYAHEKGCIIRSNGEGNLAIEQGTTGKLKTKLGSGVIKSAKVAIDMSNRFYKYTLYTQKNDGTQQTTQDFNATKSNNPDVADVVKYSDGVTVSQWSNDGSIEATVIDKGDDWGGTRTSRELVFQANMASDVNTARIGVKWEANYRRSNSMRYSCTVGGFLPPADPGKIWEVGKLVDVNDIAYGITETMMINKAVYNIDVNSGSNTDLELVTQDAFTLTVTKPEKINIDKKPMVQNFNETEAGAAKFTNDLNNKFKPKGS
jgi:prophage tail gpP-like protein